MDVREFIRSFIQDNNTIVFEENIKKASKVKTDIPIDDVSKEIIKKLKFIKKDDFVVITAGLPFGQAGMTNMIRLYKVGT